MLSREEFNQKQQEAIMNGRQLESMHDHHVQAYNDHLRAQRQAYQDSLDAVLMDIHDLERQPAHHCISQMHTITDSMEREQAILDYVMTVVRVEELLALIEAQSTDLSTVGMALDAVEQLLLLLADGASSKQQLVLTGRLEAVLDAIKARLSTDFKQWIREVMLRVKWPIVPTGEDLELLLLTCQSCRLFELIFSTCTSSSSSTSSSKDDDKQNENTNSSNNSDMVMALVEPMAAQFHFHFSLDKPTNRLDKPEWALDYVVSVIREHYAFFTELDSLIPSNLPHLFIQAMIDVVKERFVAQREAILDNMLLPVVVESIVAFHDQLDQDYQYGDSCQQLLSSLFLQSEDQVDTWIALEKARLWDGYDDLFTGLPIGPHQYQHADPIVDFLQGHFQYLRSLSSIPHIASQLLVKVTLPCLERLLQKLEFDIPAFLTRPADVQQCGNVHNLCHVLSAVIGVEWGEDLAMITLANSADCKALFTYDPSLRVGTVFSKAVDALSSIQSVCVERLYGYVKDPVMTMLSRWSSSMMYSKITTTSAVNNNDHSDNNHNNHNLPDTLRQALVEMPTRFADVVGCQLEPVSLVEEMFSRLVIDLVDMLYGKLVLRNYFTQAGAHQFSQHLTVIDTVLSRMHPHKVDGRWMQSGKLRDCVILLSLAEEGGVKSVMVLRRLLQNDKLSEATRILDDLGVKHLTVAECEQVLASRRD